MSSLSTGLRILSEIRAGAPRLTVSALAERLSLPKSTVSRTLRTLAEAGYVERGAGRGYAPGYELFRLGSLYKADELPVDRIDREISALVGSFPATGYVAVLRGVDVVILRLREGTHPLRYVYHEGTALPAFITAIGKALLARLPEETLDALLPAEAVYPPLSYRVPKAALTEEIARYRHRGWAELHDWAGRGIDAVAVAIRPQGREPIGCALSFMQQAVDAPLHARMIEAMLRLARTIGTSVGDPAWSGSDGRADAGGDAAAG